jgi:hypothetical protein
VQLAVTLVFAGGAAFAFSYGPPLEFTGAPGEETCFKCHREHPVNSGQGAVTIEGLPERYEAGRSYPLRVRVTDPLGGRWGFEITAVADDGGPAGLFYSPNQSLVRTLGPSQRLGRYYASHTTAGTYAGQAGGAVWEFEWRAPGEDLGPVRFFVVGNAANNDGTDYYDRIYAANAAVDGTKATVRARLLSPAAGDRIAAGEVTLIRWSATDGEDARPASVRVELSLDGGLTYPTLLADNLPPDVSAFAWSVPATLSAEQARVRVTVFDTNGRPHRDESAADLSIGPFGLEERPGALRLPAGVRPRTAAWGDADGDGRADLAVGGTAGSVVVYFGQPDGTFMAAAAMPVADGAADVRAVAWGDFDNDGLPDLAAFADGAAAVFRNLGGRQFSNVGAPTSAAPIAQPTTVAVLDANGDNLLDLVAAGANETRVLVTEAAGWRDATAESGLPAGGARALASGPLLAVGRAGGVSLFARRGGAFEDVTPAVLAGAGEVARLVWADLTADGVLDLLAAGPGGATVFAGRDGAFTDFTPIPVGGAGGLPALRDVAAGDYDADGDLDLHAVEADGGVRVLRNEGGGQFADVSAQFGLGSGAVSGRWADADGDGAVDLLSLRPGSVALYMNPRPAGGALPVRVLTDADGDAVTADGQPDRDALGASVRVDLDGDGDFATGPGAAAVVDAAGLPLLLHAWTSATVALRAEFPSGEGRLVAGAVPGSGLLTVGDPLAPEIVSARLLRPTRGPKLVVDGARLPVEGAVLELNGVRIGNARAPAPFHLPDGSTTRLVSRDSRLAEIFGQGPVFVRVVDEATGVTSAPARAE